MLNDIPSLAHRTGAAFTPGGAYWNQREAIGQARSRLLALSQIVGRQSDLPPYQLAQLFASAMEFAPDLIIELGRGLGNSTCAFTEAAFELQRLFQKKTAVLSVCNSRDWQDLTTQKLRQVVPRQWFDSLRAVRSDILKYDFAGAVRGVSRVLLFWDAHGFEVAEFVLGVIMPELANKDHIVLMHDMSDARYCGPAPKYGQQGLWKGTSAGDERFRLGVVDSAVAQAISIQDFATRNNLKLDSADHSIDLEITQVPGRVEEMRGLLGDELFSQQGHWFWFTLNEHSGPYTFPRFTPPAPVTSGG